MGLQKRDVWVGCLVYALGDGLAALLARDFSVGRLMGMMLVGGILYAWEIPLCYRTIERVVPATVPAMARAVRRTALSLLYFNPLWISRHTLFILLFSGRVDEVGLWLLGNGALSWLLSLPLAIAGNYGIQMHLSLRHRFLGSAVFSGVMAVCYALLTGALR